MGAWILHDQALQVLFITRKSWHVRASGNFVLLKPEYRNPHSQPLCGSGPAAATTVAASHSAAYARNAAPAPTPQSASIYYVNQPHADLITHAHGPVMNLLFTDTTYSMGLRYKSSSGRSHIISWLFSISLFSFCCVVLATLTLTMATGRKLPAAVCFLHSVVINRVGSW